MQQLLLVLISKSKGNLSITSRLFDVRTIEEVIIVIVITSAVATRFQQNWQETDCLKESAEMMFVQHIVQLIVT